MNAYYSNQGTGYENLQVTDETPEKESNHQTHQTPEHTYLIYIDKLERKVREQASRLSELEKLRSITERKEKPKIQKSNFNTDEKYDLLQRKYMQLLSDYNEVKGQVINQKPPIKLTTDFPEVEKIFDYEKLKEHYSNMLACYKEILIEKEEMLDILRRETLLNEEQRNYIEVLRQTIESDLIKSGNLIRYISLENVIDFSKIKQESDKYKRDFLNLHSMYNNIKLENEDLKITNENLIQNKEKIKQSLNEGLLEMEMCQQKTKNLEILKEDLERQIKMLKSKDSEITKERDDLLNKNLILSSKVKEINKISEDQNSLIMKRLNEYKDNYDKLNLEFELILKQKTKLEIENSKLLQEINNLKESLENTKKKFEDEKINLKTINSELMTKSSIHPNYRKLFEELSVEFEEFKSSHSRISNSFVNKLKKDFKKSQEEIFNELSSIKKLNNKLTLDLQKSENNFKTLKIEYEEIEMKMNKYLSLYESELKISKSAQAERNNFSNEINKLKDELNFQKEKNEKDNLSKNSEIKNLQEEIINIKTELKKSKEALKDFKTIQQEKEDLIEDMTSRLDKYERLIEKVNDKEGQFIEHSDHYKFLQKKFNTLKLEYEDYMRERERNLKNLSELKRDKLHNEEKIENLTIDYKHLESNYEEKLTELEKLKNSLQKFELQNEELKSSQENLSNENKVLNTQFSDLQKNFEILNNHKLNLEKECEYFKNELEHLKNEFENLLNKNKNLQDYASNLKINLYSLHSNLKLSIHKFNSYANEDLDSLLTKNFSQSIVKLVHGVNQYTTEVEDSFILQLSTDFIKTLSSEFENIYDKLIDSNNFIKEANARVLLLEKSLNEISSAQGQSLEKEKKLKALIQTSHEEKLDLERQLKLEIEDLYRELDYLKKEREEIFLELKKQKNEVYSLMSRNDTLSQENRKLLSDIEELYSNQCKLENKCIMIHKEKKYTDNLLQSLVKSYPCKEVAKCMNEVISINEFIFKTENEKINIEEKLTSMEKETKILSEDKSSLNSDLSTIVKNEQENLRKLIQDFDRKINEKKEFQKQLEIEIYNYESNVKATYEKNLVTQNELKRLQKEFEEYKENVESSSREANKNKGQFIYSDNQLIINELNSNYNNSQKKNVEKIDISCLESNIFAESNTNRGKQSSQNVNERLLTNYESIELDYTEDNNTINQNNQSPNFSQEKVYKNYTKGNLENNDYVYNQNYNYNKTNEYLNSKSEYCEYPTNSYNNNFNYYNPNQTKDSKDQPNSNTLPNPGLKKFPSYASNGYVKTHFSTFNQKEPHSRNSNSGLCEGPGTTFEMQKNSRREIIDGITSITNNNTVARSNRRNFDLA
jgi:golgin subfamily B member 1